MFTGLIETTGKIRRTGAVLEIVFEEELNLQTGDSLSVNGSCLTVTKVSGKAASFDVSPETFRRIAAPVIGEKVNLERSMTFGGRFHGHFVTGHVDCTGTVENVKKLSGFSEVTIGCPRRYSDLLVEKGSVAVSGISLTVSAVTGSGFTVALIPETLIKTSSGQWKPGTKVNLEFDIIGKYVVRASGTAQSEGSLRKYLEKYQH